tara:strand:+ start:266 stop:661 length:396 start_codon:yes stop_codon:yes gene_type:complete
MKKHLLTLGIALLAFTASAQFMVTTTVNQPAEGDSWGTENFTEELGIGYIYNDITVGIVKSGDDYDAFGRYALKNNLYLVGTMATDSTHSLSIGVGYSLPLGKALYLEPYYIKELDTDTEGSFRIGLTYKI